MFFSSELVSVMLGSTFSGMLARVPCHPLDTIKSRIQSGSSSGSILSVARGIVRAEGVRALYRGFGVAFVASAPASCLYFSAYEVAKRELGDGGVGVHLAAGLFAEAVSCVLFVPIDVLKERLQVQVQGGASPVYYRNARDAVRQIVRSGEGLRGLYRGYGATLVSFGPFSAVYFALYEEFRMRALGWLPVPSVTHPTDALASTGTRRLLPAWLQAAVGAGAGALASVLTSPLDLVKLRLQLQRGGGGAIGSVAYTGLWHGLRTIASDEGVRGLFRGLGARVAYHTLSTGISLLLFEECRAMAQAALDSTHS